MDDARRVEAGALGAAAAVLDPTASDPVRATQIAKKIIEAYLAAAADAVGGVVARETADKLAELVERAIPIVARDDWFEEAERALAAYRRDAP